MRGSAPFPFDWLVRQKAATHLSAFTHKSLCAHYNILWRRLHLTQPYFDDGTCNLQCSKEKMLVANVP